MYQEVLEFWFKEIEPSQWWKKDPSFDQLIRRRFAEIHTKAARCELFSWRETAKGRLAEIIVLDQFSRNLFRGSARSFESDPLALALSQEAVACKADKNLNSSERSFLYMPFMHSESAAIHQVAVELFENNGDSSSLDFELQHKNIIDEFGRYPHRNEVLKRKHTEQEIHFLQQENSSF